MRLIDEKGRVFGRINIIDLLVVVLIVVVAVVLAGKLMGNRGESSDTVNMSYKVKVYNVEEDVYQSIQKVPLPDQLMASGEMLNARVVSISSEPSAGEVYQFTPDENGSMEVKTGSTVTYDLTFTIEAHVANPVINEVGTQEVRTGKDHIVKTKNFELTDGIILSCEWIENAE